MFVVLSLRKFPVRASSSFGLRGDKGHDLGGDTKRDVTPLLMTALGILLDFDASWAEGWLSLERPPVPSSPALWLPEDFPQDSLSLP